MAITCSPRGARCALAPSPQPYNATSTPSCPCQAAHTPWSPYPGTVLAACEQWGTTRPRRRAKLCRGWCGGGGWHRPPLKRVAHNISSPQIYQ
ncbi:hypothetical protein E2C01_072754 [Portunus trituberculatus]|uniref:Uncharacterized protein n=1 Tax=Portunus trituberculatus TaxID=210409 RepID=A0A5B7I8P5_PORTR|nr:hypothetical protein [Portunus trituberculatus]